MFITFMFTLEVAREQQCTSKTTVGAKEMRRSRPDGVLERRTPSPKKSNPPSPPAPHVADPLVLDWGLLSAAADPSKAVSVCRACGEANDIPAPGELNNTTDNNNHNNRDKSSPPPITRRLRVGGGADESFVVLPADSNPVLSESYFSLPRNGFPSGDEARTYTRDGMSVQADEGAPKDPSGRSWASAPVGASASDLGGSLPQAGGMSIIGDGPAAGWTRAGFGAGSTMLESIGQISHAGLSDSVRKECLLHDLAKKRPARRLFEGASGGLGDIAGIDYGREGAPSSGGDPILCWHCCSSLLDRIEEDSRLADREALAYRDFVDTLGGIADSDDSDTNNSGSAGHEGAPTQAADGRPGDPRGPGSTPEDVLVYSTDSAESTFAKALEMAQQTSTQLRAEMSSIEEQRRALCVRGLETWKALSELAWARRVLGEECRELLQVSKEVAEKAAGLSERAALNDLFSIRHEHGFPTINGYRLARGPDEKRRLHWNEINAAWGEAALLVRCVANAMGFRSRRFRLVPMNCASRIVELAIGEDGGQPQNEDSLAAPPMVYAHNLFSTVGRNDDSRYRIVAAIRAFVACSSEVMAEVEMHALERRLDTKTADSGGVGGGVPYRQTEDSIGGMAIASLKNQASWKAWLCQLVKNLEWALEAASSLCVS